MPVRVSAPRGLAAPLRALVALVLRQEGGRARELGVTLSDDATLRQLNRQWRGLDKATDVLSFRYDEDQPGWREAPVQGDLIVSLDRMREQARRFGVREGSELARLVVHGMLHLCGHDHQRAGERTRMRAAEDRALRAGRPLARQLEDRLRAGREEAR